MNDLCHNGFLFLIALAGGFIGVVLANISLALLVWVCTRMQQEARQRSDRRQ